MKTATEVPYYIAGKGALRLRRTRFYLTYYWNLLWDLAQGIER